MIRLFYIQVLQHGYYSRQADTEQMKQFTLHAKRGEIYAMDAGKPVPLVMNETVYTVWADPQVVDDTDKIIEVIKKVAGGNARSNLEALLTMENSRYQILATKVSRKQAEMIKEENLAGVGFDAVSQRVYPEGQLASQVLGFVNSEGEGRYGFEQANNDLLKGRDGTLKTVTDIRRVPLTIGDKNILQPARDGDDIVLTIDRNVQAKTEKALKDGIERTGATNASAVVMDPSTGKVLAMANYPSYDPGKLNEVTDVALFNNDVISMPYESGSVIKTLTMATGIEEGVITPQSTYNNTDTIQVEDRVIGNATKGKTGIITMQDVLDWSLNTGVVTVAMRLGNGTYITREARDTIYNYFYNKFKLGQPTGIELSNEARGVVISPDHEQGNAVRYSNMVFGQGMDVSMIQVVSAFSAIINGGTYHSPTVISGKMQGDDYIQSPLRPQQTGVVSAQTSDQVREMIHSARNRFYGSKDRPGYYIGGKTGTSETIITDAYGSEETVGTYLGFGGEVDETPSYVIMVKVSGKNMNLHGDKHALPIFTDISNWMIDYLKLQPKG